MAITSQAGRQPGFMTGISLLLPITLSVMAALFVAPIGPKMAESFGAAGLAPADIGFYVGWIITVPSLCVALFSLPAGALGDRVGRRRLLIWSMAVYVLVGIAPFFLNSPLPILISRIAVGIVEAVLMTLSTTLIGDIFCGEARNRWLAGQTSTASVFAVFAIAIAGVIGAKDWHNVFLLYLLPAVFLALVLVFTWEPEESATLIDHTQKGRWSDIDWRFMGVFCLIALFGGVMFYTVQIKLPDALKDIGVVLADGNYDAARGGILTAAASFCVPVGTIAFAFLRPRISLKAMFMVEFALLAAGFLLMSQLRSAWPFTAAAGLDQIGAGMLLPTLLTWAVAQTPFAIRGRVTGIWNAVFALSQFLCNNAAIPAIMHFTHGILPTIGVLGWFCAGAVVVALVAPLKTPVPT